MGIRLGLGSCQSLGFTCLYITVYIMQSNLPALPHQGHELFAEVCAVADPNPAEKRRRKCRAAETDPVGSDCNVTHMSSSSWRLERCDRAVKSSEAWVPEGWNSVALFLKSH